MQFWQVMKRSLQSITLGVVLLALLVGWLALTSCFPQAPMTGDAEARTAWWSMVRARYGGLTDFLHALGVFAPDRSPLLLGLVGLLLLNTMLCIIARWRGLWQGVKARRVDRLGVLLVHLGLLGVVLGYVGSHVYGWRETGVVIGPGQTYSVGHGAGFRLRHDGLTIARYPDGTARDYQALVTVLEGETEVHQRVLRVNAPLSHRGVRVYLNAYGPAARLEVRDDRGQPLPVRVLPDGETTSGEAVLVFAGTAERTVEIRAAGESSSPALSTYYLTVSRAGERLLVEVALQPGGDPIGSGYVGDGQRIELTGATVVFRLDRYLVLDLVHDPGYPWVVGMAGAVVVGTILGIVDRRLPIRD